MKLLIFIGILALGAIAGGYATLGRFVHCLKNRIDHPVDNEAVLYEDENTKVVRVNRKLEDDSVQLAVIIHKDHA